MTLVTRLFKQYEFSSVLHGLNAGYTKQTSLESGKILHDSKFFFGCVFFSHAECWTWLMNSIHSRSFVYMCDGTFFLLLKICEIHDGRIGYAGLQLWSTQRVMPRRRGGFLRIIIYCRLTMYASPDLWCELRRTKRTVFKYICTWQMPSHRENGRAFSQTNPPMYTLSPSLAFRPMPLPRLHLITCVKSFCRLIYHEWWFIRTSTNLHTAQT